VRALRDHSAQKHGLYAASAALRHRNISTTAGHYIASKSRIMFEFGSLLGPSSIRPVVRGGLARGGAAKG